MACAWGDYASACIITILWWLPLSVSAGTSLATPGTYSPQGVYPVGVSQYEFQGYCPANTGLCAVGQQGGAGWVYGFYGYCCDANGSPASPSFIASSNPGAGVSVAGIKPSTGTLFAQMQYPGLGNGFALLNYDGSIAYTVATAGSAVLTCDVAYGSGVVTGGAIVGLSGGWGSGMDVLGIMCGYLQMPCPTGTYSTGTGSTQCTACASGLTSADGATSCTSCPVGTAVQYSTFLAPAAVYSASSGSTASAGLGSSSYWTTSGAGAWLQIDLGSAAIVKSSVTQGPGVQQITSYTLQSSSDGATWASAYTVQGPSGNPAYFVHSSTTAPGTYVYNFLAKSVVARYWRLTPVGYGSVQTISWSLELAQICLPLNTVCSACKACGTGNYISSTCSATSDTVCSACGSCSTGYYGTPCTATSNTVCGACSTCSTGQYPSSPCNATSNTVCSNCKTCTPSTQYVSSPCTTTSNTGCSTCDVCGAGYYTSVACTGTTNTGCGVCPSNSYCKNGVVTACPGKSISPQGSSSFLNCSCPTGTSGTVTAQTATCSQCSPGSFCSGTSCQC